MISSGVDMNFSFGSAQEFLAISESQAIMKPVTRLKSSVRDPEKHQIAAGLHDT